jgi:predicted Zn-dependent protease
MSSLKRRKALGSRAAVASAVLFLLMPLLGCTGEQMTGFVANTVAANTGISYTQAQGAKALLTASYRYARSHQDITPFQEFYLGRTVAARLLAQTRLYEDRGATDYLNQIGLTLTQVSDRPEV